MVIATRDARAPFSATIVVGSIEGSASEGGAVSALGASLFDARIVADKPA